MNITTDYILQDYVMYEYVMSVSNTIHCYDICKPHRQTAVETLYSYS